RVFRSSADSIEYTWYVRDASGNVMATYMAKGPGSGTISSATSNMRLREQYLYGSSRLGVYNRDIDINQVFSKPILPVSLRGEKSYELSNHLGNVLVTISDKKFGHNAGNGSFDYYDADIVTANDYYPFGMGMVGRKYSAPASRYRYGFNGKENDIEVKGEGNQQDYGMRMYDPRLGRFLSEDPLVKKFAMLTPYQFSSNSPLRFLDLDGKEGVSYTETYNENGLTLIRRVNYLTVRIAVLPNTPNLLATPNQIASAYTSEEFDELKAIINAKYNEDAGNDENGNKIIYKFNFIAFSPIDKDPNKLAEEVKSSSVIVTDDASNQKNSESGLPFKVYTRTDLVLFKDPALKDKGLNQGTKARINPARGVYQFGHAEVHEISHFLLSAAGTTTRSPNKIEDHKLGGWMRLAFTVVDQESGEVLETTRPLFQMTQTLRETLMKAIPRISTPIPSSGPGG
ncbi:MAG: hypothetical protein JWP37_4546, partial [Mucilaginibacter sp.]|nr:hypothetical protein [Mucilaginibacter sp.]